MGDPVEAVTIDHSSVIGCQPVDCRARRSVRLITSVCAGAAGRGTASASGVSGARSVLLLLRSRWLRDRARSSISDRSSTVTRESSAANRAECRRNSIKSFESACESEALRLASKRASRRDSRSLSCCVWRRRPNTRSSVLVWVGGGAAETRLLSLRFWRRLRATHRC